MPKKRIFQVAKELNISHVDIMEFLKENSIDVSSHMAPMDDDTYEMVLSEFNKERLEVNRLRKEQARQAIITNENETILQQEQEQEEKPPSVDQSKVSETVVGLKILKRPDKNDKKIDLDSQKKENLQNKNLLLIQSKNFLILR